MCFYITSQFLHQKILPAIPEAHTMNIRKNFSYIHSVSFRYGGQNFLVQDLETEK